jgi:peptidyl-dipeptidase Dcp
MNPFAERSTLPAELPPFADIRDDDYEPAFERGMADQTVEVAAIIADREAPTFANTIEALERSGQVLRRVAAAFFTRTSADGTDFVRDLEARIAPRLAVHEDAIHLNSHLFERVEAIWQQREQLGPEEQYLVERYHIEFTLTGGGLDEEQKDELKRMNERLSVLTTQFDANLVADTNALAVHVPDAADLDGLAPDERSAAEAAARSRGLDGGLITLVLYSGHPYLASLTRRDVRERVMKASLSRGSRGGAFDNRDVLLEIVRLRARRARLLGFDTHAALVAADQTARTPEAVAGLLGRLAPPAARNAAA